MSLSATATEMLFAIGAGDQVMAVDEQSNYPAEAPNTDLSAYEPNVEAIAAYDPDLVVIADDGDARGRASRSWASTCSWLPAAEGLDDSYAQIDGARGASPATPTRRPTVVEQMQAGHRGPAGRGARPDHAADVLPRARQHAVLGDLVARSSASSTSWPGWRTSPTRPTRTAQSAATRSCPPSTSSKADPDLVFLADTKCCAQDRRDVRRPARLRRPAGRGRSTTGWSCSTTTSPAGGARASSTCSGRSSSGEGRAGRVSTPATAAVGRRPSRSRAAAARLAGGRRGRGRGRRGGRARDRARSALVARRRRARAARPAHPSLDRAADRDRRADPAAAGGARPAGRRARSSLCGASYQGVFRNPLADPYLLGAAAGAGLGVTLVIVGRGRRPATRSAPLRWRPSSARWPPWRSRTLLGASGGGRASTASLILAGVAVASFLTAVQTYVQQRNQDTIRQVYSWILGRLSTAGWHEVLLLLPYAAVTWVVLLAHRRVARRAGGRRRGGRSPRPQPAAQPRSSSSSPPRWARPRQCPCRG